MNHFKAYIIKRTIYFGHLMFRQLTFSICIIACSLSTLHSASAACAKMTIDIPGHMQGKKVRNQYVDELLHLIFSKQNIDLTIQYSKEHMSQGRALKELARGETIDLNWSVTSKEREQILRAVRIPIYKGLIGWRVFFIVNDSQKRFAAISNIAQLQDLLAVQRFDWPDHRILMANQLRVEGDFSYEQMYKSLSEGLVDYFPRSVLEINREKEQLKYDNLKIEQTLLIKYPSATYFFVNKEKKALAKTIEEGFKKAIADGSYHALFDRYFTQELAKLSLDKRKVIELNNPYFPITVLNQ